MVHLFEDMPDTEPELRPNIRWKEFSDALANKASTLNWPVIYQFDYIDQDEYQKLVNQNTILAERKYGEKWSFFKQFDHRFPNKNIKLKPEDYISTSDEETAMIIELKDPKIVLFGGLHQDRCVTATKQAIRTADREYHVSELLSYTWKQTWQNR